LSECVYLKKGRSADSITVQHFEVTQEQRTKTCEQMHLAERKILHHTKAQWIFDLIACMGDNGTRFYPGCWLFLSIINTIQYNVRLLIGLT